mmetsp:Transcript_7592/g.16823  ORF Transcript_7592/g.16823 Transcript_7592/m.16823 type:complete len:282 (+) Transcript_7592:205-1050(+)
MHIEWLRNELSLAQAREQGLRLDLASRDRDIGQHEDRVSRMRDAEAVKMEALQQDMAQRELRIKAAHAENETLRSAMQDMIPHISVTSTEEALRQWITAMTGCWSTVLKLLNPETKLADLPDIVQSAHDSAPRPSAAFTIKDDEDMDTWSIGQNRELMASVGDLRDEATAAVGFRFKGERDLTGASGHLAQMELLRERLNAALHETNQQVLYWVRHRLEHLDAKHKLELQTVKADANISRLVGASMAKLKRGLSTRRATPQAPPSPDTTATTSVPPIGETS